MKIVEIAVTIVIGVVLFSSLLLPTISTGNEALYTTVDYDNAYSESQISLSPIDEKTSNTINVTSSGITTNNGDIALWDDTSYTNVVFITERMYVSLSGAGSISVLTMNESVTATSFTAVISAGEFTYSIDGADAATLPYSNGYVADPTGSFTSVSSSETPYIKDKFAQARFDSTLRVYIDGQGYNNAVEANMAVVSTEVEDTDGEVKQLSQIKYTSSRALNTSFVVEKKVQYTYADDPAMVSLISIIPILVILALVMFVIYSIVRRGE